METVAFEPHMSCMHVNTCCMHAGRAGDPAGRTDAAGDVEFDDLVCAQALLGGNAGWRDAREGLKRLGRFVPDHELPVEHAVDAGQLALEDGVQKLEAELLARLGVLSARAREPPAWQRLQFSVAAAAVAAAC